MKPKSAKSERKKLPRCRILWCDPVSDAYGKAPSFTVEKGYWHTVPCIVTEAPTLKSAKARLKIEQMTEEELVEGVAKAIWDSEWDIKRVPTLHWDSQSSNRQDGYRKIARSILSFLGRSGT